MSADAAWLEAQQPVRRTCDLSGKTFVVEATELELLRRIPELNPALGISSLPLPRVHPLESLRQIAAFGNLLKL